MKFFLDTANLDQIREANDLGVLDGVTTNPSLMAKEGIRGEENIRKGLWVMPGAKHNAYGQPRRHDGGAELVGRESIYSPHGQQGCHDAGRSLGKKEGPRGDNTEDRGDVDSTMLSVFDSEEQSDNRQGDQTPLTSAHQGRTP